MDPRFKTKRTGQEGEENFIYGVIPDFVKNESLSISFAFLAGMAFSTFLEKNRYNCHWEIRASIPRAFDAELSKENFRQKNAKLNLSEN